jgi:hypothetical protein
MDRAQARSLLRKINQLFDAVADAPGTPSRIERDLLCDYTRQFYDSLTAETASAPVESRPAHTIEAPSPSVPDKPEPAALLESTPAPPAAPAPPPAPVAIRPATEPVRAEPAAEAPARIAVPEPEVVTATVVAPEPEVVQRTTVHVETVVKTAGNGFNASDMAPLFAIQESRDLSDKLRLSRVDDLSRAMGINERFLTINELFGGDHESFDHALRSLNSMTSFQDARDFLEKEIIGRYGWLDERRQKKALVFIQLVQRRYS